MRLTIEDDRERLQRFAHLRPASRRSGPRCGAALGGRPRKCTLARGHSGPHASHGAFGKVVAVWDEGALAHVSQESLRNRSEARGQGGLPTRRSEGFLSEAWARTLRILASPEELFLFILFIAFAGFAIDWFLRILG